MEYSLKEIAPEGFSIKIKDKNGLDRLLVFGIYTWGDAIYFENKYGKDKNILGLLVDDPNKIIPELCFRMLENKKELELASQDDFVNLFPMKYIAESKLSEKIWETIGICVMKAEVKPVKGGRFSGEKGTPAASGRIFNLFKQLWHTGRSGAKNVASADTDKAV
jgi:hypothetical protein